MNRNNLVEFRSEDEGISLSIHLDSENDTIWMTLNQVSALFQRDKSVISRHLKSIFDTGELEKSTTVAFFATVQEEGGKSKTRNIEHFNLDAILSVGYRVNSKRGTEFRKWSSRILKDQLIKGYSLNKEQLTLSGLEDLSRALDLMKQRLLTNGHISDIGAASIEIIRSYSRSWLMLSAFDENRLPYLQKGPTGEISFTYEAAVKAISQLKSTLIIQQEATPLFGFEREEAFKQIIGSIHQTFDSTMLYPSVFERAAHLFYFTIKDHPFSDGNKRVASFMMLLYLSAHEVEITLSNEALVALALLVAQSQPSDKDIMVRLVLNLLIKE